MSVEHPDTPAAAADDATHRALAVSLFNSAWTLLEKPDRTPDDDAEMVRRAYASRWHWGVVGTPLNLARRIAEDIEKDDDRDWLIENLDALTRRLARS